MLSFTFELVVVLVVPPEVQELMQWLELRE
jgi:hypothetical protein